MTREQLLEHICFTNYTSECSACDGRYSCQDCKDAISPLLDKYEEEIRADERKKTINECKEVVNDGHWFLGYTTSRIANEINKRLEQLKGGSENG